MGALSRGARLVAPFGLAILIPVTPAFADTSTINTADTG
jgi:hypothetical protein